MGIGIKGNKAGSGRFAYEYHGRADLEAECCGSALEGGDATLALLLFVVLLPLVDEGFAACEHEVNHSRELVGDGRIGAWLVHATAQTTIERAERGVAMPQTHRRNLSPSLTPHPTYP